jgi:hypothetical protein
LPGRSRRRRWGRGRGKTESRTMAARVPPESPREGGDAGAVWLLLVSIIYKGTKVTWIYNFSMSFTFLSVIYFLDHKHFNWNYNFEILLKFCVITWGFELLFFCFVFWLRACSNWLRHYVHLILSKKNTLLC